MMQQTSLSAYEEILPSLGRKQRAVFDVLRRMPEATNGELQRFLGWPINTITPRVRELVRKGVVMESKRRTCSVTGRTCIAWKVS